MPSSNFQDYNQNTPITASWLNGVNKALFGSAGNNALTTPAAWVRFNGTTGAVVQAYNVAGVTRTAAGVYTITYTTPMAQAGNCYTINTNLRGFQEVQSESINGVVIETDNQSGVATDPTIVSVVVFGAYLPPF